MRAGPDSHLAEDLLQETFLQIYRKLAWLRHPELFRPWAYRIAARLASRRRKAERHRSWAVGDEQILDAAEAVAEPAPFPPEWVERLPGLIATVSSASQAVLMLHYLEGLSLDEVAVVLDVPVGTAKSRLSYGLATLRRRFESGPPRPPSAEVCPDDRALRSE